MIVHMKIALLVPVVVILLGACATPKNGPEPSAPTSSLPKPAPVAKTRPAPKGIKPAPIPTRAITVKTDCAFRDETGYNGALKLAIEQARVQAFDAWVNIPRRGTCRFDLRNFTQTRELPTIELTHLSDRCVVRVWEQGERVTVAFNECQKMCSGDAWEQLWPILNDRRDGSCA
jgi:hypothetical protein